MKNIDLRWYMARCWQVSRGSLSRGSVVHRMLATRARTKSAGSKALPVASSGEASVAVREGLEGASLAGEMAGRWPDDFTILGASTT